MYELRELMQFEVSVNIKYVYIGQAGQKQVGPRTVSGHNNTILYREVLSSF